MIQARTSTKFTHVLTWVLIVSLTFGFCSSWSLHFVGMLSCSLDVPIGLDVGLTLFTGALAVGFTFISLGKDVLRNSYFQNSRKELSRNVTESAVVGDDEDAVLPLLEGELNESRLSLEQAITISDTAVTQISQPTAGREYSEPVFAKHFNPASVGEGAGNTEQQNQSLGVISAGPGSEERAGPDQHWSIGNSRVDGLVSMATQGNEPHNRNAFSATLNGLWAGFCLEAVLMGLLWSLSLTCMHYGGLFAMEIPEGYMSLNPLPVVISAVISWVVCIAGYIYMTNVEPFLSQQVLFSIVAAVGIATMHFTGKSTFQIIIFYDARYAHISRSVRSHILFSSSAIRCGYVAGNTTNCYWFYCNFNLHVGQWSACTQCNCVAK